MIGEVIIREVKPHGNGAYIYVPKRWLGFVVRCEVKRKAKV
jgi:putative transposon-encoded protein